MGDNPAMAYEYFKDLKGPSVPKLLASTQAISLSYTHTHSHKIRFSAPEVGWQGLSLFNEWATSIHQHGEIIAQPIVAYNSSVCVWVWAREKEDRDRPTHCSQLKRTLPCSIPPHLPPFLHQRMAQKRRKLMNRRSLRSQMEYGFLFARNLRNTIVPNQNSMCSPTMVSALSSAASIGLVFETWSVQHKDLALLDVTVASLQCVRVCVSMCAQKRERENTINMKL